MIINPHQPISLRLLAARQVPLLLAVSVLAACALQCSSHPLFDDSHLLSEGAAVRSPRGALLLFLLTPPPLPALLPSAHFSSSHLCMTATTQMPARTLLSN